MKQYLDLVARIIREGDPGYKSHHLAQDMS